MCKMGKTDRTGRALGSGRGKCRIGSGAGRGGVRHSVCEAGTEIGGQVTWRQEYNEERTKRSLGGLTPAQYAKQLAARPITMPENSKSTCY